eukprot:TRINITY_DN22800_c0_g1_i3.p1 TRINITY_DN22800_c0_g1~~TRINITY_DN22800_c0_g1_i3.p1  ORF type:complete len:203 (+),score=33.55 TRINITY_DN22800_c0_g1_i3:148-756(+)
MFAQKYKEQINKNPQYRNNFNELCLKIGVDPMSSKKNVLSSLGFGDFYIQLTMVVLDICEKEKSRNGGIMSIKDIIEKIKTRHKNLDSVTSSDICKAIDKAKILGNFQIFNQAYVSIVPIALSNEIERLMSLSDQYGCFTEKLIITKLQWSTKLMEENINILRQQGLIWLDKKTPDKQARYYFISMLNSYLENIDKYSQIKF